MCCHTQSTAKRIFAGLSAADPSVGTGNAWTHETRKHDKGRAPLKTFKRTAEVLDASIKKAASSAHFRAMSPQEQSYAYAKMNELRAQVAEGKLVIPEGIAEALAAYAQPSGFSRGKKMAIVGAGMGVAFMIGGIVGPMAADAHGATISDPGPAAVSVQGKSAGDFQLDRASYATPVTLEFGTAK